MMKNIRFALAILFLGSLAVFLTACGGSGSSSGTATLVSIAVTPANPSIPVGVTRQFTASGIYSDGTSRDITTQVTWSSSNPVIATVNGSGLATAVTAGTAAATIKAASGSISGSTTLTVTSATLASLSVTQANPRIPLGATQQFAASGAYSDGTSYDITTRVTWTSSNPSVATVNSNGLATAIAAGTATITATITSFRDDLGEYDSYGNLGNSIFHFCDPGQSEHPRGRHPAVCRLRRIFGRDKS